MKKALNQMAGIGQFAELKHGKVRYQIEGPANGAMVVMVHGLAGHMHIWDKNYDYLVQQGFRVLRSDLYPLLILIQLLWGLKWSKNTYINHFLQFMNYINKYLLNTIDITNTVHYICIVNYIAWV